MPVLPYSRVVNVTLTRNDNFPTIRSFAIPALLTSETVAGELDSTHLSFQASSTEEISDAGFSTSGEFYKAATYAFAQNPSPVLVKALWYDGTNTLAAEMTSDLDDIINADSQWYWLTVESGLRDDATLLPGVITWTETKKRQLILDSNDANIEDSTDTTNIAYTYKDTVERTSVFYSQVAAEYNAFGLAGKLGTFDFDVANTHYTAKFKGLALTSALDVGSNALSAITGFTPDVGQAAATGHLANCYIDIGGQHFVVEGSTLTPNLFIDEIHTTDWIIARTEETLLGILLNNAAIPMDRRGMAQLASAPRQVMSIANRAGLIANDFNISTGTIEPSVTYDIPDPLTSITAAQRNARIAPAITVRFRYAGAVHYATVNYFMNF